MNVIGEVLERSRYEDGIKPEFDQHKMAEIIESMPPLVYEKFCGALSKASVVYDLFRNNNVELKGGYYEPGNSNRAGRS